MTAPGTSPGSTRTIGEVAGLAGVSVRTLHHYDQTGLLAPAGRSAAGYRLYDEADLARLRQILYYRELGFGLDEIAGILADPAADTVAHLRRQHGIVRGQIHRRQRLLAAIERELEAHSMGIGLTPEEQFEVFGTDRVGGEWTAEAERRWGETSPWRQSQRRAAAYTKQDWLVIKAEADAIEQAFAAALASGAAPDSRLATEVAERHRQHITGWFCDCEPAMHRGLAEMYLADPRFGQHYDRLAPGLAQYVHDAIVANAGRAAGG